MKDLQQQPDPFALPSMLDSKLEETFAGPEERYQEKRNRFKLPKTPSMRANHNNLIKKPGAISSIPGESSKLVMDPKINGHKSNFPNKLGFMPVQQTKKFNNYHWKKDNPGFLRQKEKSFHGFENWKGINSIRENRGIRNEKLESNCCLHSKACPNHPVNKAVAHTYHDCCQKSGVEPSNGSLSHKKNIHNTISIGRKASMLNSRNAMPSNSVVRRDGLENKYITKENSPQKVNSDVLKKIELRCQSKERNLTVRANRSYKNGWDGRNLNQNGADNFLNKPKRSESIGRYAIPPIAKPVRSVSNLSEVIKKIEGKKMHRKEHIYDTIDSFRSHRNALERIDDVLKSSKSFSNMTALNYDVPKKNAENRNSNDSCDCGINESCENDFSRNSRNMISKSQVDLRNESRNSDAESTATYATIVTKIATRNENTNNSNISTKQDPPLKIRTLDIKEERRKTPDIVKCSRYPRNLEAELKRGILKDQMTRKNLSRVGTRNDSLSSSDIDNSSTVIYIPTKDFDTSDGSFNSLHASDARNSFKALSNLPNGPRVIEVNEDEIYSVVEDWPMKLRNNDFNVVKRDASRFDSGLGSDGKQGYFPEYSNVDSFSHSNDSTAGSSCTSSSRGNSSSGSPRTDYNNPMLHTPPNVTFCSSADELVSMVSSDPSALVYVYKYNGDKTTSNSQPPSVFILARNLESRSSENSQQSHKTTSKAPVPKKEISNPINNTTKPNKATLKKEPKLSIFQKLKRIPTIRDSKNRTKLSKSKSSHNLNAVEAAPDSQVVFVEPNYKHDSMSQDFPDNNFRFDYSTSWQSLGHFK